ncbi:MAG: hypothetical protein ACREET_09235 [Stellaceae bacterium]
MPADTSGCDEAGFAFTDDDFARRYAAERAAPRISGPADPAMPPIPATTASRPIHGGGNSYMRARRRRLAARGL